MNKNKLQSKIVWNIYEIEKVLPFLKKKLSMKKKNNNQLKIKIKINTKLYPT